MAMQLVRTFREGMNKNELIQEKRLQWPLTEAIIQKKKRKEE